VAASSDDTYDGKSRTVSLTNLDDDAAEAPETNLSFLPSSLEFGDVFVNSDKTLTITVVNTDADNDTGLTVVAAAPFTVKSGTSYVADTEVSITVAKGQSATVKVRYSAGAVVAADSGTLTFKNLGGQTVEVIAISARTVELPEGGTLKVAPETTVVKGDDGTALVTFDVELDTATAQVGYSQMTFEIHLPSVVTANNMDSVTVTTNRNRTNNIDFAVYKQADSIVVDYLDLSGVGISAADGKLLTIEASVDLGAEAVHQMTLTSLDNFGVKSGEASGHAYELVTQKGYLAVSNYVVVANLDVNEDGFVNTGDLILVYRGAINFITKGQVSQIAPDAWGLSEEQKTAIADNVDSLADNGLDVNEDGFVNTGDLILVYRGKINFITKDDAAQISPDAWGLTTEQKEKSAASVEAIMP
jgi:hypothetical protein